MDKGRGPELVRVDADANSEYRWALAPDGSRIAVLNAKDARIDIVSLMGMPSQDLEVKGRNTFGYEKAAVLRMEFKTFLHAFMLIPVQVVRTSRRLVFRLLAWNLWQAVFLRGFDHWREPLRC
jgi:hypothetical protein